MFIKKKKFYILSRYVWFYDVTRYKYFVRGQLLYPLINRKSDSQTLNILIFDKFSVILVLPVVLDFSKKFEFFRFLNIIFIPSVEKLFLICHDKLLSRLWPYSFLVCYRLNYLTLLYKKPLFIND